MYSRFLFDAAVRRAQNSGLSVISVCHASLPPGVPCRDHYGNYVNAFTVYIGKPGSIEKDCAYGRSVCSIHQTVSPGMGEALADISRNLRLAEQFQTRDQYEDYFLPSARPCEVDQLRQAWRDIQNCSQRARRCLPPLLVAWLINGAETADHEKAA